MMVEDKKPKNK